MSKLSFFSVSNIGLGKLSLKEAKELLSCECELKLDSVIFKSPNNSEIINFFKRTQSTVSLSLFLSSFKEAEDINFNVKELFNGSNIKELSFKLEITGVKGNENRIELGRQIYPMVTKHFKESNIDLKLDFKKPDIIFQVYFTGEEYLIGLRLNDKDFDGRTYRLFSHQASFKGDFAYKILRNSKVKKGEKTLFLLSKDSVLPIEAALYVHGSMVRKISSKDYIHKIPYFTDLLKPNLENGGSSLIENNEIISYDESLGNHRASRNNAKLAGVLDNIKIMKFSLDDLELKVGHNVIDRVIVQITRKDEDRLNEIYYQLSLTMKKGGEVFFISRPSFELIVSSKFEEISKKTLNRGKSSYLLVELRKK